MPTFIGRRGDMLARGWFGSTTLLAAAGLALAAVLAYRDEAGFFRHGWPNAANEFAYFTEQSNLIVAATCALLAVRLNRVSTRFRTARLTGLTAIIVTGVVYHVLLSGDAPASGWARIEDADLHTIVPVAATLGFVLFGPRELIAPRVIGLTLIFLVAWAIFTTIRGAIVDWYPYGFIDVAAKGYPRVALNALGLAIAYAGIGCLLMAIDHGLTRRRA